MWFASGSDKTQPPKGGKKATPPTRRACGSATRENQKGKAVPPKKPLVVWCCRFALILWACVLPYPTLFGEVCFPSSFFRLVLPFSSSFWWWCFSLHLRGAICVFCSVRDRTARHCPHNFIRFASGSGKTPPRREGDSSARPKEEV